MSTARPTVPGAGPPAALPTAVPTAVPVPPEPPLPCHRCGAPLAPAAAGCPVCAAPARRWSPRLHATDPPPVRRRVAAAVVDVVPLLAAVAGLLVVLLTAADPTPWQWVLVAVAASWVLLVGLLEGVRGASPGKLLCRLTTVDVVTTGPVGAVRGLRRTLVRGGLGLVTLGLAGLSVRTDPEGRERTWWDRDAGTRVVAGRPGHADGVPAAVTGVTATTARWAPQPQPPSQSQPAAVVGPRPPVGIPPRPAPATPAVSPTVPPRSSAPTPAAPNPAALSAPRSSAITPTRTGAGPTSPAVPPRAPGPGVPVQPGSWGAPAVAPGTRPAGAPGVPPGVVADPAPAPVTTPVAADATRVVPRDALGFRATTATLEWDTGARVVVGGTVIIGRDPVAADGEQVDRRVAVDAGSVGVSKTHLTLSITTGGTTVTDRHSTNGVRLERADGSTHDCEPGVATPVQPGDRIRFGGRSLTLVDG